MNDTRSDTPAARRPSPLAAVLLSCFCAGLGQLYCGRTTRAAILFSASLLFAPIVLACARGGASDGVLALVLITVVVTLGVHLYSIVDAFLTARRAGPTTLGPVLAAVLAVVGLAYPVGAGQYLREHAYEAFLMVESSMLPALLPGDRVLANKHRDVQRGDLAVFAQPGKREQLLVKRVVALAGDRVGMHRGKLVVNGRPLPLTPVRDEPLLRLVAAPDRTAVYEHNGERRYAILIADKKTAPRQILDGELSVPPGTCFVLGDNRPNSVDSRSFGCVPLEDVRGLIEYIFAPARGSGRFGRLAVESAEPFAPPGPTPFEQR